MLARVLQPFTRRGEIVPPGTVLDIPDDVLPKLAGLVEPFSNIIPLRRAWIENGELRVVGTYDDLAKEIVSLTIDDLPMQRRLLSEHCQAYGPAHIHGLIEAWEERAAIMEHEAGVSREQAEEDAAKQYHLTAWLHELQNQQLTEINL